MATALYGIAPRRLAAYDPDANLEEVDVEDAASLETCADRVGPRSSTRPLSTRGSSASGGSEAMFSVSSGEDGEDETELSVGEEEGEELSASLGSLDFDAREKVDTDDETKHLAVHLQQSSQQMPQQPPHPRSQQQQPKPASFFGENAAPTAEPHCAGFLADEGSVADLTATALRLSAALDDLSPSDAGTAAISMPSPEADAKADAEGAATWVASERSEGRPIPRYRRAENTEAVAPPELKSLVSLDKHLPAHGDELESMLDQLEAVPPELGGQLLSKVFEEIERRKITALEFFFQVDTDGDGAVDRIEFGIALERMLRREQPALELDLCFAALDTTGAGRVELGRFVMAQRNWRVQCDNDAHVAQHQEALSLDALQSVESLTEVGQMEAHGEEEEAQKGPRSVSRRRRRRKSSSGMNGSSSTSPLVVPVEHWLDVELQPIWAARALEFGGSLQPFRRVVALLSQRLSSGKCKGHVSATGLRRMLRQLGLQGATASASAAAEMLWEVADDGTKLGTRSLCRLYLRCIADSKGCAEPRRLFCVVEFLLFARSFGAKRVPRIGAPSLARVSSASSIHAASQTNDAVNVECNPNASLELDYHGALALLRARFGGWEAAPQALVSWLEAIERKEQRLEFGRYLNSPLNAADLCPLQWRAMPFRIKPSV